MLILNQSLTFAATAKVNLKAVSRAFGVVLALLANDEADQLRRRWTSTDANGDPVEVPPGDRLTTIEFARRVLAGFGPDVTLAEGTPAPYTPENVDALLNVAGVPMAIVLAWLDGYSPAEEKNSAPLPAGLPDSATAAV